MIHCKNCKYSFGCKVPSWCVINKSIETMNFTGNCHFIFWLDDGKCIHYERKWYKFWIKPTPPKA